MINLSSAESERWKLIIDYRTNQFISRNVRKRTFCARNETTTTNQPVHPRSLIWVFVLRMKKRCILGFPKCAQWRFWSDCANAQSDLNLHWTHMTEGTISDFAAAKVLRLVFYFRSVRWHFKVGNWFTGSSQEGVIRLFLDYVKRKGPLSPLRTAKDQISLSIRARDHGHLYSSFWSSAQRFCKRTCSKDRCSSTVWSGPSLFSFAIMTFSAWPNWT